MASKVMRVIITGDVKGAIRSFAELDVAAGRTGDSVAAKWGKIGLAVGAATVTAAAASAVALYKIGETFDEQYDKIRVGTGATGQALKGLEADFKTVVQQVPTDFNKASDAITVLNQKLGLTGKPLQDLAGQFLNVSRITKTDLTENLKAGTDMLNSFGIQAKDQPAILDQMYRAAQLSGLSFTDMLTRTRDAGIELRGLGLNATQAAALVATLGKAGVDTSDALPSLKKALAEAATAGVPANEFFKNFINTIKSAPDPTAAAQKAIEVLGKRTGGNFAQLVREGKLSYDDMLGSIVNGKDTINQASKDTEDFSEKWLMFKNKVLIALEPVATKVFSALGVAMDKLPGIIQTIQTKSQPVVDFFVRNWPEVQHAIEVTASVIADDVIPRIVEAFNYLKGQVQNLVAYFSERWNAIKEAAHNVAIVLGIVFLPTILLIKAIWSQIGDIISSAWEYIKGIVQAGVDIVRGIIDIALGILTLDFDRVWNGIKALVTGVWEAISATIGMFLDIIRIGIEVAFSTISGITSDIWNGIAGAIGGAWEWIKGVVSGAVDAVVGYVTGIPGRIADIGSAIANAVINGFKSAWNAAANVINSAIPNSIPIPFAPDIDLPDNPIPRLAKGGIVTAPTLALIGEAGPEAVVPLNKANNPFMGGGDMTITIPITLDGRVVTEVVVSNLNRAGGPKILQRAVI